MSVRRPTNVFADITERGVIRVHVNGVDNSGYMSYDYDTKTWSGEDENGERTKTYKSLAWCVKAIAKIMGVKGKTEVIVSDETKIKTFFDQ